MLFFKCNFAHALTNKEIRRKKQHCFAVILVRRYFYMKTVAFFFGLWYYQKSGMKLSPTASPS